MQVIYRVVYCFGNKSETMHRKEAYALADNPPDGEKPRFIEKCVDGEWYFYCWA